jgi:hypothetical protein
MTRFDGKSDTFLSLSQENLKTDVKNNLLIVSLILIILFYRQ